MGPILRKLPLWRQMISFLMMIAFPHSHQLKIVNLTRGCNNRASALGTDETIIIDAENDLNLQEK